MMVAVLCYSYTHKEQTCKQNKNIFTTRHLHGQADTAIRQTKALVVNGDTQTAVSCCCHFCALGVLWWDGTDTHHTEARAQGLKSNYDVILEGENNQHFVTTKQYTVLAQQTRHTTKPFLGYHFKEKKLKQDKLSVRNTAQYSSYSRLRHTWKEHSVPSKVQTHNSLERISSCLGVIQQSVRKT